MDVFEAIEKRACVRKFAPAEITDEEMGRILDAGHRAPSGMNKQPLEYIVVRDKATIASLARVQQCVGEASAVIAIVASPFASEYWLEDASAACENMFLAITALGYATVWVQGTLARQEDMAKEVLGIPDEKRCIILLPIGRDAVGVGQAEKKPLSELVHREKYGQR